MTTAGRAGRARVEHGRDSARSAPRSTRWPAARSVSCAGSTTRPTAAARFDATYLAPARGGARPAAGSPVTRCRCSTAACCSCEPSGDRRLVVGQRRRRAHLHPGRGPAGGRPDPPHLRRLRRLRPLRQRLDGLLPRRRHLAEAPGRTSRARSRTRVGRLAARWQHRHREARSPGPARRPGGGAGRTDADADPGDPAAVELEHPQHPALVRVAGTGPRRRPGHPAEAGHHVSRRPSRTGRAAGRSRRARRSRRG